MVKTVEMLLVSDDSRPGMSLTILLCTRHAPQQRIVWAKASIVLRF